MKKIFIALVICGQAAHAFWPFGILFEKDTLPSYVLAHPLMNEDTVYGVGNGKSFLEAKSKALNDIATQLRSDVRSITSVRKNSDDGTSSDQQITVLTQRMLGNYTILEESQANGEIYLLIQYKR